MDPCRFPCLLVARADREAAGVPALPLTTFGRPPRQLGQVSPSSIKSIIIHCYHDYLMRLIMNAEYSTFFGGELSC